MSYKHVIEGIVNKYVLREFDIKRNKQKNKIK